MSNVLTVKNQKISTFIKRVLICAGKEEKEIFSALAFCLRM